MARLKMTAEQRRQKAENEKLLREALARQQQAAQRATAAVNTSQAAGGSRRAPPKVPRGSGPRGSGGRGGDSDDEDPEDAAVGGVLDPTDTNIRVGNGVGEVEVEFTIRINLTAGMELPETTAMDPAQAVSNTTSSFDTESQCLVSRVPMHPYHSFYKQKDKLVHTMK
jgi:hypothetical protein